ncbi:MAG TPA: cytochrome b N-terminal domain-containing protein [Streptosporangiaceae bacterium]|nr:cytochrome b N-terminal domain-containing protein [Streptosporangiaceae bacterium]
MFGHTLAITSSALNLNAPGSYLHWNIFYVSLANLVLVAVMVVIFGAALLLPFPKGRISGLAAEQGPAAEATDALAEAGEPDDARMWTARVRNRALRLLPPGKLLPDRQPAYVSSWIYVFGVASLAALGMAIVSGLVIAVGGVDWWHINPVGHFFNSLHLWSAELFMALIVIHLWGKFWMAAWRGRRAATWITGVVAFLASIVECFTGYLSQQNFDSQWISTSGKDAFNSVGVGAFFNLMNFGQMLLWHVVLIPIVLIALVGAHILLVRMRGVVHPIGAHQDEVPGSGSRRGRRRAVAAAEAAPWRGPTRRYDIVKEGAIAVVVVLTLTLALAGLLSSPDVAAVTVQTWSRAYPADFLATAASELNATSETASYGPPYNNGSAFVQRLLFSPQTWPGVTQPINAAQTFVLQPLSTLAPTDPSLASALATYTSAPATQQLAWATAYYKAVESKMPANPSSIAPVVPAAKDGPVPVMLTAELSMARSGALDTDLLAGRTFYGTDFTKPLLFIEDGAYFTDKATAMNLSGSQWGVMNETGGYPGQPWLWLYTLWYQIPSFSNSANVDMIAIYLTGLATILLLLVPFIPGLRDIPRLIPVHRLIWRPGDQPAAEPDAAPEHRSSNAAS